MLTIWVWAEKGKYLFLKPPGQKSTVKPWHVHPLVTGAASGKACEGEPEEEGECGGLWFFLFRVKSLEEKWGKNCDWHHPLPLHGPGIFVLLNVVLWLVGVVVFCYHQKRRGMLTPLENQACTP